MELKAVILKISLIIWFLICANDTFCQKNGLKFTHLYIEYPLEPDSYGTGGFTVSDFDNDGDIDITIQRQETGRVYWYQNIGSEQWIKYEIATEVYNQLGAVSIDINKDGRSDLIMGTYWLENPGHLLENPDQHWIKYKYNGAMSESENHDIVATDINHDGSPDIVVYIQNYNNGAGTLRWFDITNSKPYLIRNVKGAKGFRLEPLPFPEGPSGSLHSLGVADFDNDGDPDIFSGEQEDPDAAMKPSGLAERGFLWVNKGSRKKPVFEYQIINTDNPGWHDTILRDMDGDGDIDIITKVWNADEGIDGNPDRKWHISYWLNDSIKNY